MTQFASNLYPQTNPSNPILLSARTQLKKDIPLSYLVWTVNDDEMIRMWRKNYSATARQVSHARRVLTRLASITG